MAMEHNSESGGFSEMSETELLANELRQTMTKIYGPLLYSRILWKILAYPTPAAYRQARTQKRLPFNEFTIEGRRGYFVLTQDVANWLAAESRKIKAQPPDNGD